MSKRREFLFPIHPSSLTLLRRKVQIRDIIINRNDLRIKHIDKSPVTVN